MGDVLASKGDDDEATGYYERASRQITKVLGMRHPEVIAQTLNPNQGAWNAPPRGDCPNPKP
jgi:hypothetical protein